MYTFMNEGDHALEVHSSLARDPDPNVEMYCFNGVMPYGPLKKETVSLTVPGKRHLNRHTIHMFSVQEKRDMLRTFLRAAVQAVALSITRRFIALLKTLLVRWGSGLASGLGVGLGLHPCVYLSGKCFPARKNVQYWIVQLPEYIS